MNEKKALEEKAGYGWLLRPPRLSSRMGDTASRSAQVSQLSSRAKALELQARRERSRADHLQQELEESSRQQRRQQERTRVLEHEVTGLQDLVDRLRADYEAVVRWGTLAVAHPETGGVCRPAPCLAAGRWMSTSTTR